MAISYNRSVCVESELQVTNEQQIDFDSISELVPRAKNGDTAAFDNLLSQLQGYLANLARQQLNPVIVPKEGHSDIVQLTLIQAVESFDSFRGTTAGEFNNWIKVILENTVKQVHRCLLYTSPSPRDLSTSRMPSSA